MIDNPATPRGRGRSMLRPYTDYGAVENVGFAGFLEESFAILRREIPAAYAALCRCLAPHAVLLIVDDEPVPIRFEINGVRQPSTELAPSIDVRTNRAAILDLIDARCTLHDAIVGDRLFLRGRPEDLLRFHDGLLIYLHGAVRAPSFPTLLHWFRSAPQPEAH